MTNEEKRNIYNAIQNLYNMDFTTWQEVLAMMYNLVADVEQQFEAFQQKFGLMLGKEVTEAIKKMYDDGTLAQIINEEIFSDLNNKIDKVEADLIMLITDEIARLENKVLYLETDKTGITDISTDLKEIIEKANRDNKNVVIPKGLYQVSKPIVLSNIENVSISCETGATFEVSLSNENIYNVISFNNSKNIEFMGGKCINTNDELRNRNLYNGAFLTFNSSAFIKVHDCSVSNMNYLVQLYTTCNDVQIYSNSFYNTSIKNQSSMSAILCYSSYNVDIHDNFIQGQTYDGTISVFGSGSNNVNVYNNRLINYSNLNTVNYLGQGITVDQGCKFVEVYNNEVRGYWYGIDIKSNVEMVKAYNNNIKGCKIGIANRDGEATEGTSTNEVYIFNNLITFNELYHKNIDTYALNGFQQIGVSSVNRYGCNIVGNEILVNNKMTTACCGIYYKPNIEVTKDYLEENLIKDNKISLLYAFGSFYYAIDGSSCIFVDTAKNLRIENNYLRHYSVRVCEAIQFKGINQKIYLTDNNIKNQNTSKRMISLFDDNTSLINSFIVSNKTEDTVILICDEKIVETKNNYFKDNIGFRQLINGGYSSKLVLGTNTADVLYRMQSQYTPSILLEIKGIVYNTGECFSSLLSIKIDGEGNASIINNQYSGNESIKIEIVNNAIADFSIRINNQTNSSIRIYTMLNVLSSDQLLSIV